MQRRFVQLLPLALAAVSIAGEAFPPPIGKGNAGVARAADVRERRQERQLGLIEQKRETAEQQFAQEQEEIAAWCQQQGLDSAAAEVRAAADSSSPPLTKGGLGGVAESLTLTKLPDKVQVAPPLDLPAAEREWRIRLRSARERHARRLYPLSRDLLYADAPSLAYHLLHEVAALDPDHVPARRLLGYVRHEDRWVTPFEARQLRTGHIDQETFGWLPKDHVARYEQGWRYYERWMPAAQEAAIRSDFRHAWEVRTAHFLVKTNHSLERGVEVARRLEDYHRFFMHTFAGFFSTPEQIKRLFQGQSTGRQRADVERQYVVHYYRDRDEYNRVLKEKVPQIEVTNGLYYPPDRIAYFYHDPAEDNTPTLYHEASHQLFYESSRTDRLVGDRGHFWIIEGIACYLESYAEKEGRISVGDPRFIRFYWARRRLLDESYHVPLEAFGGMSMREFQSADVPELQRRYSQASGMAHFFMHHDGGRYRDGLIEHLSQIYRGDPLRPVATLAELTGVPAAELDVQYRQHIEAMEQAVQSQR